MRAWLQPVVLWGERRLPALTRYRRPESLPVVLHRRRIYIVPSGFGVGFSLLLLTMLAGALNYANNAALLLTCLLGAASAASMLVAFRNLNGLQLSSLQASHAIAGQPVELTLRFASAPARDALRLDAGDARQVFAVPAQGSVAVTVNMATTRRGWQPVPRLKIWTTWPLGMFRAWSWVHPDQRMLVWPRAEHSGPPPQASALVAQRTRPGLGDEWASLRDYRIGDPQRHIAWKASAHHESLLVRDFAQPRGQIEWRLDWRELQGLDHEARIARLARWLGEAQARRQPYSLWLPGNELPLDNGPLHYARCMNALAELP